MSPVAGSRANRQRAKRSERRNVWRGATITWGRLPEPRVGAKGLRPWLSIRICTDLLMSSVQCRTEEGEKCCLGSRNPVPDLRPSGTARRGWAPACKGGWRPRPSPTPHPYLAHTSPVPRPYPAQSARLPRPGPPAPTRPLQPTCRQPKPLLPRPPQPPAPGGALSAAPIPVPAPAPDPALMPHLPTAPPRLAPAKLEPTALLQ
jgi:hypothetical protein